MRRLRAGASDLKKPYAKRSFLPRIAFGQRVASLSASRIVRILGPVGPGLEARSYAQVARRRLKPQKRICETLYFGLELHLDSEGLHFLGSKPLDSSPRVLPSPPCPSKLEVMRRLRTGASNLKKTYAKRSIWA